MEKKEKETKETTDIIKRRLQFARNIIPQFYKGTDKQFAHPQKFDILVYDLKPSNG